MDWSGGQAMNLHFRPQGPASYLDDRRSRQHRQLHPSAELPRNLRLRIRLRGVGSTPSRLPKIERVAVGILEVREGTSLVLCDLPFKMDTLRLQPFHNIFDAFIDLQPDDDAAFCSGRGIFRRDGMQTYSEA